MLWTVTEPPKYSAYALEVGRPNPYLKTRTNSPSQLSKGPSEAFSPVHGPAGGAVDSLHEVAEDVVVLHEVLGALLGRAEVVLHRALNLVVRNAAAAVRDPLIKRPKVKTLDYVWA